VRWSLPSLPAGWPDWANFCLSGYCLVVKAAFWKFQNFWTIFPRLKLCIILAKKGLGYILGDFFHKLTRSPC
jgi:hypothetical protein